MKLIITENELLVAMKDLCSKHIEEVEVEETNHNFTFLADTVKYMHNVLKIEKIPIIKFIREQTRWGLRESKEFAETHSLPF